MFRNVLKQSRPALAAALGGAAILAVASDASAGFVISDPDDALSAVVDPSSPGFVTNEVGNITKADANALSTKVVFQFDVADNTGPDNQFGSGLMQDATIAITGATAGATPFSATLVASPGGYSVLTGATAGSAGTTSSGGRLATNRGTITLDFDTPVQVFGAVISNLKQANLGDGSVQFYAQAQLLETLVAPIGQTNFAAYDAGSSLITRVVFNNSAPGNEFTLDDFLVSVAVPEPASLTLLALGGLALLPRRRQA